MIGYKKRCLLISLFHKEARTTDYHLPYQMALTGNIVAKVNLADSFSTEFVADVDQAFLGDRLSQEWFYKVIRSGY